MELIEVEPHFWELYRQNEQLFLSIAIDLSSVVCCWDIVLTIEECRNYQLYGRSSIDTLTQQLVQQVYQADYAQLEQRPVSAKQQQQMQNAFKVWRLQHQ